MDLNVGGRAYLVAKLGEHGLSRRRSLRVLNHMFKEIKRALARGEEVEFAGGRLRRREKQGTYYYSDRRLDYPAHWDYWTVEWVPRWETLKQLVGPEAAGKEAGDFFFDEQFFREWHREYRAKQRRAAAERKRAQAERRAARQKFGKVRKQNPSVVNK